MEIFGKFMTIVLAIIISPIIRGFVTAKLWLWFVVPIFGLPELRIIEAIGIMFLIGYIAAKYDMKADKELFWERLGERMTFLILIAGFALLSGWLLQMFM